MLIHRKQKPEETRLTAQTSSGFAVFFIHFAYGCSCLCGRRIGHCPSSRSIMLPLKKAPVTTAVTVYFNRCCGRRIGHCPSSRSIMLLRFVDGSEYVLDLVGYNVLDCLTGRFQILTRIEVVRMLSHILTDRGCHCKSDI